jgi:NADH:ubiquinone oxidoreductase subunit E
MAPASAPPAVRLRKIVYLGDPLGESPPPDLLELLGRYRGRPDLLVALLLEIQSLHGYLPKRIVQHAARELDIPLARLHAVATFYKLFRVTPPGRYAIQVCRGSACYVAGSSGLLDRIGASLGVRPDETTPDGLFSLQTVECVGCCSLAPVVVVNRDVHGRLTPQRAVEVLRGYAGQSEGAAEAGMTAEAGAARKVEAAGEVPE